MAARRGVRARVNRACGIRVDVPAFAARKRAATLRFGLRGALAAAALRNDTVTP